MNCTRCGGALAEDDFETLMIHRDTLLPANEHCGGLYRIVRGNRPTDEVISLEPVMNDKHSKFSEKFYTMIAEVLKEDGGDQLHTLSDNFARIFEKDNPAFDRDRFLKACGREDYQ